MRALFILLLIYFLTGTLQITGDHTFGNNDDGFTVVNDNIAFECILSSEIGLSESMIENSEDQDDETTLFFLPNTISDIYHNNILRLTPGKIHHVHKTTLIHNTNLPPPYIRT